MSTVTNGFHFYSTPEYLSDLAERISHVDSYGRVMIATMTFHPENPAIRKILDELCAAARRGTTVTLLIDAKSFLLPGGQHSVGVIPGPLFFNVELPLRLKKRFKTILAALEEIQDAGGNYKIINQPGRRFKNPIAGRSHIKFSVINDAVYTGGCNLDSDSHIDMMIGWQSLSVADWLVDLGSKIAETGSARAAMVDRDMTLRVNEETELIVDAGVRGQSLIFHQALELIDQAKDFLVISSQFFPNDVTARHLLGAYKRGVNVQIFYNHPSQFDLPHNILHYSVVGKAKLNMPQSFFAYAQRNKYLHAKLVVSENAAMIGSHNQVSIGVKLGTAEIDLLSTDPEFGKQLLVTLRRQIDTASPVPVKD